MAEKKKEEKSVEDIFEDKRTFIHEGNKYYIDDADLQSVKQADWQYSKTYNEVILAGIATMAQMEDILEERAIIGKSYDKRKEDLIALLDQKVLELESETDNDKKLVLADEVEDIRNKLFRHNQRASSPMSNTCEQLAEDARIGFLTSAMIKDIDGNRVWESYESFLEAEDPALAVRARYEAMLALQGLSSDFLEQTPEAIARKSVKLLEESDETQEPESEPEVSKKSSKKPSSAKKSSKSK